MSDRFSDHARSLTAPAEHGFAVAPSDTHALAETPRAIYVGTGGTIVATMMSGADVTFENVLSGTTLPIRCVKIKQTNTTATDIIGLV